MERSRKLGVKARREESHAQIDVVMTVVLMLAQRPRRRKCLTRAGHRTRRFSRGGATAASAGALPDRSDGAAARRGGRTRRDRDSRSAPGRHAGRHAAHGRMRGHAASGSTATACSSTSRCRRSKARCRGVSARSTRTISGSMPRCGRCGRYVQSAGNDVNLQQALKRVELQVAPMPVADQPGADPPAPPGERVRRRPRACGAPRRRSHDPVLRQPGRGLPDRDSRGAHRRDARAQPQPGDRARASGSRRRARQRRRPRSASTPTPAPSC